MIAVEPLLGGGTARSYELLDLHNLQISTQHSDSEGRPDMILWLDDWPWVVVENKVGHLAELEQLARYAAWQDRTWDDANEINVQRRREPLETVRHLAFVTHQSPVPKNFSTLANETRHCTNLRWSNLAEAGLRATDTLSSLSHAKACATAFDEFLKEQNMASQYPTTSAIAAGNLLMREGQQLEDLANHMLHRAERVWDFSSQTTYWAKPNFRTGIFSASRWAKNIAGSFSVEVITGIFFPQEGTYGKALSENLEIDLGDLAKVFISINDKDHLMHQLSGHPENWYRDGYEFVAIAEFSKFKGDPDARGEAILDWCEERAKEFKDWSDAKV